MDLVNNILGWYREDIAADYAAHGWYTVARREARRMARDYGVTVHRAAGVIAALSPAQTWAGNLTCAEKVLLWAATGRKRSPKAGFRGNVEKAWAIAHGARPLDILAGPKVRSFYRNMTGDMEAVTVDRWAARAAGLHESEATRRYDEIAAAYRAAAAQVGVAPAVMHAVVWCAIRGRA